ncbi:c-type cytochrome biogenesis protein CcmI [Acidocella sp.]|uniref:c-type cytochrome biogenesis protein CcmI n=1 Tax=Acidocella sp. TaxID=50710 RepID=UPI003D05D13C
MTLILMAVLALILTLPLLLVFHQPRKLRERRDAAMALHRAQLTELDRDLEDGRIDIAEHAGARLEIERRLLAADALPVQPTGGSAKLLLIMLLAALPIGGFALYWPDNSWYVPSEPHARWEAQQKAAAQRLEQIIALLRAHLAKVEPNSADASQGQAYLAEALTEQAGGITPEALSLFKQSLADAPEGASWRQIDEQRLMQAKTQGQQ